MTKEYIDKLNYKIENIKIDKAAKEELRIAMKAKQYEYVVSQLEKYNKKAKNDAKNGKIKEGEQEKVDQQAKTDENEKNEEEGIFPALLQNPELECDFIGMLLEDPKLITKYYFLYEECSFEMEEMLNIYQSILFTEGSKYASEKAKRNFNLPSITKTTNELKARLKKLVASKSLDPESLYIELKKLFVLRKNYLENPIKSIQDQIAEIINYKLYDKMDVQEVKNAVNQVMITEKFKRGVLNTGLTDFLKKNDNTLTNGLDMPFPIISGVFKGLRKGETMSYAMPSNAGKSRFTINLAAYMAFVHKQKILIISNEMSEEKMRLCLITTIINNPEIQKLHGQKLRKTEGEILEFQYRPDDASKVEVDEDGFVKKKDDESQEDFVKRLSEVSSEFNKTIAVTDWINNEVDNSIYFIHITDHTNEELQKIVMNYYYKEKIEYVFYDTLKTDTENIGNSEEVKKTATILSNLAQNFNIFICSSLQLQESNSLPVNLTVNDLAISRTVKEVLDTLCLIKQINNDTLQNYEYSLNEVDTKFFPLEKFQDPDVRYYACVIDKNRAGAKPTVVFRLNLAYNEWEELRIFKVETKRR